MIEQPGERPSDRPPMTPDRFNDQLEHLGMTHKDAHRLWRISYRRIRRFAEGEEPVPYWIELLLLNVTALGLILNTLERHFTLTGTRPVGFGPLQQLAEDALERATGKRRIEDVHRARNP